MAVPEICEWKSEHARPLENARPLHNHLPATTIFGRGLPSFLSSFLFSFPELYRINFFDQRRIVVYTHIYIYEFAFYPIIVLRFKHRGFGKSTRIMINK